MKKAHPLASFRLFGWTTISTFPRRGTLIVGYSCVVQGTLNVGYSCVVQGTLIVGYSCVVQGTLIVGHTMQESFLSSTPNAS